MQKGYIILLSLSLIFSNKVLTMDKLGQKVPDEEVKHLQEWDPSTEIKNGTMIAYQNGIYFYYAVFNKCEMNNIYSIFTEHNNEENVRSKYGKVVTSDSLRLLFKPKE